MEPLNSEALASVNCVWIDRGEVCLGLKGSSGPLGTTRREHEVTAAEHTGRCAQLAVYVQMHMHTDPSLPVGYKSWPQRAVLDSLLAPQLLPSMLWL